jgi:probable rRNA maturation factor
MNIVIANRQRKKRIQARFLRGVVDELIAELRLADVELGISLVGAREMALLNETFLQHEGPTDVITFDHAPLVGRASSRAAHTQGSRWLARTLAPPSIHGELFVCVEVAMNQAKEFKTSWQSEVVRYVVHGILHLLGYDDLKPHLRRAMKREENRLMRRLESRFSFAQLSRPAKLRA